MNRVITLARFGLVATALVGALTVCPLCVAESQTFDLQIIPSVTGGARIWTDKQLYYSGEAITVFFSVDHPTVSVSILDFDVEGNVHQLPSTTIPQQVMPGQAMIALTGRVSSRASGTETLVLYAQTTAGQIISAGCTFAVEQVLVLEMRVDFIEADTPPSGSPGGVYDALRIGFNPSFTGCGGLFKIGQVVQTFLYVRESGTYGLYNVTRHGTLRTLIPPRYFPAGTQAFPARISGVPGTNTAVFHGTTDSGITLNTYCSMNVTY